MVDIAFDNETIESIKRKKEPHGFSFSLLDFLLLINCDRNYYKRRTFNRIT